MKQHDENQLKAIRASSGHFLVLAPPGCGKTDILAERVAYANEAGVDFGDMLCLTFTNRASRGMRSRISERVGRRADDVFVGNIHRFCSRYIFGYNMVPENTSIMDEEDMSDLFCSFDAAFFRLRGGASPINKAAVKYVSDLANYISQSRMGHPAEVKFTAPTYPALYSIAEKYKFDFSLIPDDKAALKYALMYCEYKHARNIIDFADILILAYESMSRDCSHRRYSWIQVDEVQDLNGLQLAIIDLLETPEPTVMYLGDEQQAIFSFMGAKLSLLTLLKKRCEGNILTFGNNYRAPEYLLDVCNDFAEAELKVDPGLLPRAINTCAPKRTDLILTESETAEAERKRIVDMVNYYLGLDDSGRMAILVSKNDEADAISYVLTAAGISNFKISGRDMFKSDSYKMLAAFYSVIANDFNFMAWARLIFGVGAFASLSEARNFVSKLKPLMMTPSDLISDTTYLQRFVDAYNDSEMVFFDTETTGLNVLEDDIVQIAAFKVSGGIKVPGSEFNILLHTDREIPAMLGDIENPLVKEYAENRHFTREAGLRMFVDYIGDCPVLGHNVMYDYLILQNNVERTLGIKVEYEIFDSLHLIKCVAPDLKTYKLGHLLENLDLKGENSHLADEDIAATKSLVDYCVERIRPVLASQLDFLAIPKVKGVIERLKVLKPLFVRVKGYMYSPVSLTGHSLAAELAEMYHTMRGAGIMNDLGPKFDVFIKYVENEWTRDDAIESLYDQIYRHIYDITSTINEGDLVNSDALLSDRVFIMTVYKGKGLEFDNVAVLGAVDGAYPFFTVNRILSNPGTSQKDRDKAMLERMEDARKLYVAISRAKKRLCISYYRYNSLGYFAGLSPFVNCIKRHFYFFAGRSG